MVRAFATSRHLSRQGLRALRDVDSPVVGVVLNAVDLSHREYNYSYQYYYHREGYAAEPAPEAGPDDDDGASLQPPPTPPN